MASSMRNAIRLAATRNVSVRAYSTATEVKKAPITVPGVAGRYATALYSAAFKKNALDTVEKDLIEIAKLKGDDKFNTFIESPVLNANAKADALKAALTAGKFSELTINLFETLAENNRLAETQNVVDSFGKIMSAHRGEVTCVITTAKELDAANLKNLKGALAGFVQPNEKLNISTKVDATIVGGVIVDIGEKRIDMSVATKVKKISEALRESI
eukprot:Colp12_sorted_trinity150504_noHs@26722